MPVRYLVIGAAAPHHRQPLAVDLGQRLGFRIVFASDAVAILANSHECTTLHAGSGVVIGPLFRRFGRAQRIEHLDEADTAAILQSEGKVLIERYWGAYLAILAFDGRFDLIRDPSGALPCYSWSCGDDLVYASDPDVLVDAGLMRPTVDWDFIPRYFHSSGFPTAQTGLEGLTEFPRGSAAIHTHEGAHHRVMWDPWAHVGRCADRGIDENADTLGQAVLSAVAASASVYRHILIGVSGGLDSSIVTAGLAAAKARFSCMTLATDDPEGDERAYARMLCERFAVRLDERPHAIEDIDLGVSSVAHLPRPVGRLQALAYDAAVRSVALEQGADAFFSGNGGDNVFAFNYSAAPIVDRLLAEGLSMGAFSTIGDVCALTGANLREALAFAYRVWTRRTRGYRWNRDPDFLHRDIVASLQDKDLFHPWLDAPAGALPGQMSHLALLLRTQQQLEGYDRTSGLPVVNPLMSQPVIECCLGIPSWQWISGGKNRSVARFAFEGRLPELILSRQSKGGPDAFCHAIIEIRRGEIQDRLLNGHLAKRGIIDRTALEGVLFDRTPDLGGAHVRIMAFLDTEAWIDHWLDRGSEQGAA
jgi:asparagine synthase (glutamine-hydrolysing)